MAGKTAGLIGVAVAIAAAGTASWMRKTAPPKFSVQIEDLVQGRTIVEQEVSTLGDQELITMAYTSFGRLKDSHNGIVSKRKSTGELRKMLGWVNAVYEYAMTKAPDDQARQELMQAIWMLPIASSHRSQISNNCIYLAKPQIDHLRGSNFDNLFGANLGAVEGKELLSHLFHYMDRYEVSKQGARFWIAILNEMERDPSSRLAEKVRTMYPREIEEIRANLNGAR